jgi:predicted lipoprotein with Yx(FWY)xxD motif
MKLIAAITLGLLVAGCGEAYASSSYGSAKAVQDDATLIAGHGPLTAANGMTLYTFDNDTAGTSNCYDNCAVNWPPYTAAADAQTLAEGFSIVERRDGTAQWAKDSAPLYFWIGDTAPGDISGDGVGGVWHIAK